MVLGWVWPLKWAIGSLWVLKNHDDQKVNIFSFKLWGMKMDQYTNLILNLSEDEWDTILEGAESYLGSDASQVQGDDSEEDNDPCSVFLSDEEHTLI